jgi:uncharacterized protein (DUF1778 family)
MTNINIEIPDDIYKKVKLAAIMQDKSVKDFIIERLEAKMNSKKSKVRS